MMSGVSPQRGDTLNLTKTDSWLLKDRRVSKLAPVEPLSSVVDPESTSMIEG